MPVATILYILDDSWSGGLEMGNMVFSAVLGATFAYTVFKTSSIWLAVGLGWGGNVMYRMLYGFGGQGIWRLENTSDGPLFDYITLAVTVLMFPVVYRLLANRFIKAAEVAEAQEAAPAAKIA